MAECGAQDVRQLQYQPAQLGVEAARLGVPRSAPGVCDQARRHGVRTTEHLAFGPQRTARVAQHLLERLALARAELRGSDRPQLAQRAAGAGVDGAADLAFELQPVAAQPFALDAAWRHFLQHRIDQARQRAHELGRADLFFQHEREVVS